ncbi:MAG: tetratricopeptide repeat protein [Rickettsiales bacterium]
MKKLLPLLIITALLPNNSLAAEMPLTTQKYGMRAYVSSPINCRSTMDVNIKATNSNVFTGSKINLQKTLGLVRTALNFECNGLVSTIKLNGIVGNRSVYQGTANSSNNWVLKDINVNSNRAHNRNDNSTRNRRSIFARSSSTKEPSTQKPVIELNKCDKLAAHPNDKQKNKYAYGVGDNYVKIEEAIDACIESLSTEKDNPNYNFQLGRVLFLSQMYDEAIEYFTNANNITPYPAAIYYLAMIKLQKEQASIDDVLPELNNIAAKFAPAASFVAEYQEKIAAEKSAAALSEMNKNFIYIDKDIAGNNYNYPGIFNNFVSSRLLEGPDYSIMAVTAEMIMGEIQGWCPGLVKKSDVRRIAKYIDSSPNSAAYKKYARANSVDFSKQPLMMLMSGGRGQQLNEAVASAHINNKVRNSDDVSFKISSDVTKLMKSYDCSEREITALTNNINNYIKTAPPYNTVSESYWNACMKSSLKYSTNKSQFCGCFLDMMRGGGIGTMLSSGGELFKGFMTGGASYAKKRYINYKIGHDLIRDFSTTASTLIKKHRNLQKCTKPKDDSFRRFMNGETDSYGRPIRRRY